jgi:transcriptional regulator with XRE-family HTH domain
MNKTTAAVARLREMARKHPKIQGNETELARRAQVSQSTVSRIMTGGAEPRLGAFISLVEACGSTMGEILEEKPRVEKERLSSIIKQLEENDDFAVASPQVKANIIGWVYNDAHLTEDDYSNVINMFKYAASGD